MMSAADVQESLGQPSAKSSGSLFRIATLAEDRAYHAAQNRPPETGANRRALAFVKCGTRGCSETSRPVQSPCRQHYSQARSCCTTGSTKVMCNVIGPLEPSSNTRSLLRVAPNPRTTPCLPLRRGPAASQMTTRSPTVQSWSVLSLAHATLSIPGLYPSQFQPRRKRHAVKDSHNRGPTPSQMLCVRRALPGGSGPDWNPPVGVRTSRMLVYFELEDPFCSGLYPLV